MTSKSTIALLDKYEFHDMAVESINFNIDDNLQLIVTALPFDAHTNDYEKLKLTFSHLIELKMNEILLDKNSEIELNSFDYEHNGCFNCKLIFLPGFGRPSFTIELKCEDLNLTICNK